MARKSSGSIKFKKAVFKTVEANEEQKSDTKKISNGFLDIESSDGQFRYKIGLIDFLTKYSNIKMLENEYKAIRHGVDKNEISAID